MHKTPPPKPDDPAYLEWRSCKSKKQLGQRTAFEQAFKIGGGSYKCSYCTHYHVTSRNTHKAT